MSPRATLVVAVLGCNPSAGTVGAWTGDGSTSAGNADGPPTPTDATTDPDGSESTAPLAASTGEPGSSSSASDASSSSSAVEPGPKALGIAGVPPRLHVVDLDSGQFVAVCEAAGLPPPDAIAMLPDGRLVASSVTASTLTAVDACDCTTTPVAPLVPEPRLHALAPLGDDAVIGPDATRASLLVVSLQPPAVEQSLDFAGVGEILALAAPPAATGIHALADPGELRLWHVDPGTGLIDSDFPVDAGLVPVAATWSPAHAAILACTASGALWLVDADTGDATELAVTWPVACRTLAAPPGPMPCLDALF
jgi:hypothetical protein